ncbi:hypothetical protein HBH39_00330 [Shewanella aestuarii]|uniref:Amino acid ABC transporter substrate-binding protein n=2 Tax=Shewanella aestuarii TaxID=1028752 RepID=A0A6G9QNB7_9GAMM|nr:hypothetical protein HBH39_00330 [Shewanella aestuarii]
MAYLYVPQSKAVDSFIINHSESANDFRYEYTYALLQLVIEATQADFGEANLQVSSVVMSRNRQLRALESGEVINIMAEAANTEWNDKLLPVYIPIRKGVQGFRVFIITQNNAEKLSHVKSLEQLMQFPTGSGSQWTTKIAMQQAGFNVVESTHYDSLFNMLSKERFITFGRGVNEAFQEVTAYQKLYPQLMLDEHLVLHIPLATYFYVSPNQPRLAERVRVGLERIISNGKFDQFFYQHHCDFLRQSKLNQRVVLKIDNPLVSEQQMTSIVGQEFLLDPKSDFASLCQPYQ